jgi:hypothetical protein
MAQIFMKKRSDGKPKAVEGTDNGEIYFQLDGGDAGLLADILAKLSADPATQTTLAAMAADIALMKADLAVIRAILES